MCPSSTRFCFSYVRSAAGVYEGSHGVSIDAKEGVFLDNSTAFLWEQRYRKYFCTDYEVQGLALEISEALYSFFKYFWSHIQGP